MKTRKTLAIFMSIAMVLGILPSMTFAENETVTTVATTGFMDMPVDGFWSAEALRAAVSNGLLNGFAEKEGTYIKPNDPLTRAQLATIVNRAFGAQDMENLLGVVDVPEDEWFYKDMQKAVKMGTMKLDATMRPNDNVTREEAFTILGRALKMQDGKKSDLSKFSDASLVSDWAVSGMGTMVKAGYIKGDNNLLDPTDNMTRAQFAVIMNNIIKQYIRAPGIVKEVAAGNIMISVAGVTLEGVTITGDLILGDGVDNGTVILKDVIVKGKIIVRSGNAEIITTEPVKNSSTKPSSGGSSSSSGSSDEGTDVVAVSSITVSPAYLELTLGGETELITATVQPSAATNKEVTWESSNEAVATVVEGRVTQVATGKATITVKTKDGGKTAICEVTVVPPDKEITGFTALADVNLDVDEKLINLRALVDSKKLPTEVTIITETTSAQAIISAWVEDFDGAFDGASMGAKKLTASWKKPAGYVDEITPITIELIVNVNTAQTQILLTSIEKIIGTAQVNIELTAGKISPSGARANYQWMISDTSGGTYTDIDGASNKEYTPVASDVGKFIKVVATGRDSYMGSVTSSATVAVLEEINFAGGNGTVDDPYQVATAKQLSNVRNYLNKHYKQTADIKLDIAPWNEGYGWEPIGNNAKSFRGSYDGNGFKVSGLTINSNADYKGLFGSARFSTIKNVKLTEVNILGDSWVGGLVGINAGKIEDCNVSGSVEGSNDVGGLVGLNGESGKITKSFALSQVEGKFYVGGLVGANNKGKIENSYSTGSVIGKEKTGGLVGENTRSAFIKNSYSTSTVTGATQVGGLVGYNVKLDNGEIGTIENSYAIGKVSGKSEFGGLVGKNDEGASIISSYYDLNTTYQTDSGKGVGKTTIDMMKESTFGDWDFSSIWKIDEGTTYPNLVWQD